jgi:hypothetical protein
MPFSSVRLSYVRPWSVRRRAAVASITLIAGIAGFCALGVCGVQQAAAAGSLERTFRILAGKTFVDLTHSFGPDTPVWAGFGQAVMTPAVDPKTHEPYTIAKDGFRATTYQMVGQYGTHIDPPAHFAENGATMDRIPPKQMILRLVVLDDTPYLAKDPNHAFSPADLAAWEKAHGRVPKGAFAALRTDMSKDWTPTRNASNAVRSRRGRSKP